MAQEQGLPPVGEVVLVEHPPLEWADAWLKTTGIRTTYRERESLALQFKAAMEYAVAFERGRASL